MVEEVQKPTCFVIQQFDNEGTFDRRYMEAIRPALISAGVEPLRADTILGLTPIINKIETAIRAASICIAEISNDNPNVWLELGFALALGRPTVILCDKQLRKSLPFDISHRPVILYRSDSKSGFEELERNIIKFVKNQLDTINSIGLNTLLTIGPKDFGNLKGYEIAILATLLTRWTSSPEGVPIWEIEKALKHLRFTDINLSMGITSLLTKVYITQDSDNDMNNEWFLYRLTPGGIAWLQANEDKVELQSPPQEVIRENAYEDAMPF